MGDFLADFRPQAERRMAAAAEFLKFLPDMRVEVCDFPQCGLVLSSPDDPALWGSFSASDGSAWVGLCGRLALESKEWTIAQSVPGTGGLACKYIWKCYSEGGVDKLAGLSGNFVMLIFDRAAGKFLILTDRWGLVPAFRFEGARGADVFSSHPDALADCVGESRNWDLTSFADFVLTGKLWAPYTYYRRVRILPSGSAITVEWDSAGAKKTASRPYFDYKAIPEPESRIDLLAEEFAAALRKSVTKRTLPILGASALGLSGGLDSRSILSAAPARNELISFSCYDAENPEFRTAQSIAREAGVKFVPLRRSFDYYTDSAVLGARVSGGMGCIASNHFMGFRDELRNLGARNLLTGCYCDYLYKGLALNKSSNRWANVERLDKFAFDYYAPHSNMDTDLSRAVQARLGTLFPPELRQYDSESTVIEVEHRRLFPMAYEEDNAERTIPQRIMGWYVPIAENDLMTIRLKMSISMRLNRRLFAKMTPLVCGPRISGIPDANTGAPVNASIIREAFNLNLRRAGNLLRKLRPSRVTAGSWMNWGFYIRSSKALQALWSVPNPEADDIFRQILGPDGYSRDVNFYDGRRLGIFLQLFTLKLWLDQRPR